MDIQGKRIVITGASRGLGRLLALGCLRAGAAEVVAGARERAALEPLLAEAGDLKARIVPVKLDVTAPDEADRVAALGRADILINNAGVSGIGNPFQIDFASIILEIEVNYLGLLRVTRAFAPAMVTHGDGLIVNVASVLAKVNLPMLGTYSASKAAVHSLGQAMRGALVPRGVRVITVYPSTLDTDMAKWVDGPKDSPAAAADDILEAIRQETIEAPVGDGARQFFARFEQDPVSLQETFLRFR